MKTIVLGLDGASYELIDPWIKEGELPNLERIKKNGVYGDLESQLPPVTAPNWKCYSTGKNPGKIGVFWWENIDWNNRKVFCPDYRSRKNREIWDLLNKEGIKVAIINFPTSYPPKKVNGYLISGGPDAGAKSYYYPSSLNKDIEDLEYNVRPSNLLFTAEDCRDNFKEIIKLINSRFKLAEELLNKDNKIEFVHLTIFLINVLHHFLWDDNLVKRAWKTIDKNIGEILEKRGGEFNLIIMSDHGSNEIRSVFNVNTWLEKQGFLTVKKSFLTDLFSKLGLTRLTVGKLIDSLRIRGILLRFLPDSLASSVPSRGGGVSRAAKEKAVDWEKSLAVASGQGPVYINKEKLGENYEEFRGKLAKKLEEVESTLTGNKIVRDVYRKEELYSGKYLKEAPDLIINQAPHTHISEEIGENQIFEKPDHWMGENKRTGLFAATGPEIKDDGQEINVSILDLAPTILHIYGSPIPNDMDGKVLKKVFAEGSEPAKSDISFTGKSEEEKLIKSKIASLKKSGKI